jgi:hypothetical protein
VAEGVSWLRQALGAYEALGMVHLHSSDAMTIGVQVVIFQAQQARRQPLDGGRRSGATPKSGVAPRRFRGLRVSSISA